MDIQAHRALEYLHPDNLIFRFTANWVLATALKFQGDRAAAARACQESIAINQKSGDVFSKILVTSTLGELQELDNQLHRAAETYQQGLSNREIGERLFLALDTVKGHNRRIFDKLQVQSRTEAIARARELGLL